MLRNGWLDGWWWISLSAEGEEGEGVSWMCSWKMLLRMREVRLGFFEAPCELEGEAPLDAISAGSVFGRIVSRDVVECFGGQRLKRI